MSSNEATVLSACATICRYPLPSINSSARLQSTITCKFLRPNITFTSQPLTYDTLYISGTSVAIATHSTPPVFIVSDRRYPHPRSLSQTKPFRITGAKSSHATSTPFSLHSPPISQPPQSPRSVESMFILYRSICIYHYSVHWITLPGVSKFHYIGCIYMGMECLSISVRKSS